MSQISTITVPDSIQLPLTRDFEQIYREYALLVYRTAWGVLGNPEDAEDVLQAIFLRLLRRELPPDMERNPKGYFHRAAVNESLNILKARRRGPVLVVDAEQIERPGFSSDSSFDEELHQRLYEAIAQLSPEAAEIVVLRYMHNKSTAEIAKSLGVPRTVVGVRLFRSRARLKKLLGKRNHETR